MLFINPRIQSFYHLQKNKIFTLNGLDMNLEQAVLAFKKTNKVKISLEKIRAIMKK